MANTKPEPKEDPVLLRRELEATRVIHEAMLSVPPKRRGAILQAVAILMNVYIPRD